MTPTDYKKNMMVNTANNCTRLIIADKNENPIRLILR